MTQNQEQQFQAALARAERDGCRIIGKGTVKSTGAMFYAVTCSQGTGHAGYSVLVRGETLMCTCPAAEHGEYCKHRALVRATIISRAHAAAEVDVCAANARRAAAILVPNTARRSRFL